MDLRSAARGFLAFLLSVPVLQGNDDWRVTYSSSNVCALRGATVAISCTYEYPDNVQYRPNTVRTLWLTKGDTYQPVDLEHDTDYRVHVESSCGEVRCTRSRCHGTCTLRIKDLRQSDSDVYRFSFTKKQPDGEYTGDPGVTLSVTDLQVKVSFLDPISPTWAELECHSMCDLGGDPRYTWFRNGQNVRRVVKSRDYFKSEGSYSCAVEGYEQLGSPLVLLQGNGEWTVTYSSSNVCALRGATVDISCTYEYPDDVQYLPNTVRTLWFTKGDKYQPVDLEHDTGRVEFSRGEVSCTGSRCHGTCTLRIKDLRQSDSAVYKFRFTTNLPGREYTGDPGVKLSVTDLQVKVSFPHPTNPTWTDLECHSMCDPAGDPPYIWFRNGQNVGQGVNYRAYIQSEGSYSCAVEGYEGFRSPLVYAPKTPSVTVSPSGEIEEGSSVSLSCSSDANPAANYTWFRVNPDYNSREMKQGPQLVFRSILSADSGQYYCLAQTELRTKSELIYITVTYAPKTPSVTVSPSGEIEEGSSVTLSCSSDANPAAEYTWFREQDDSVKASGQNYTITNITSELEGYYYCQAHNTFGHHNSTFLLIKVCIQGLKSTSTSWTTTVAVRGIVVLLATVLLLVFLWMRRKRASSKAYGQGGRPDTVEEPLPGPVYENVSALTNHLAPAAQREPIEEQDDHHYASIHTSRSENQEVPRCWVGSNVQSDQADAVFYSVVNIKRPNAVPGESDQTEAAETSELYSTVKKHPRY
ncbi:sialoadhesin-like isoform X2 [Gadus morhua]|uniref:sialoadhesin-like isoform X2 n=1 Tax=Gadus morhua TaxID=8049 RepID=UPI0011B4BDC2|nr:sialoadhesin-like isoform X2 [Gadus morhua]